jgi:hypothetical protein
MLAALQTLLGPDAFAITVRDVDADEALVAQYDELVPVLVGHKEGRAEQQLCHYFLDEAAVKTFIAQT